MYPIAIGAIVFVCAFGGAMVAMYASPRVPDQHLSPASVAVIRLAMAFVVALATLVISLMISSARSSFVTKDSEYRRGAAHTNSIESVWAVLKRGIYGVYHQVSAKHLGRYVSEVSFRLNAANVERHTLDRLDSFVAAVDGKRLTYARLIA